MTMRRPLALVNGAGTELPSGDLLPLDVLDLTQSFIWGLRMVWVSATSITVTQGGAFIEGRGRVFSSTSDITVSSLSLTASTLYHVYFYSSSGTPAIEVVTTAPASPFAGDARSKTGNSSRRYVGSVLTDSSGNIISFVHSDQLGRIDYRTAIGGATNPLQVLNNGRATTGTNVSCAAVVSPTATHMSCFMYNDSTTAQTAVFAASDGPTLTSANWEGFCASGAQVSGIIRLDSSQRFSYEYLASPSGTAGFTVRVNGYYYAR